ncbi:Hpt domain-containing protein [Pseudomonas abieticivorans]|uniref:Hpt domain-containing protein n=1 Tax=Pseudomonas abieticivorans TaxID=2931382 RepID=UPI0020BEE564|nr:Hpt domain-containing protein [Pseudomonas sp. PIA16]
MTDRHDYVALAWVKGEIGESLKQARAALDAFVADPGGETAMVQCLACLHQVHGSLQMIEFYGAALLAEEMEQLALALARGKANQQAEAVKWLVLAFAQLPVYLERVHLARRDLPLVVLPLINDLRSARGQSLLAETSLFSPPLLTPQALDVNQLAQLDIAELPDTLRALHHSLHSSLLGLLREQELAANLAQLGSVFRRLEELCADAPLSPLWEIDSALVEGMIHGFISNSPALRSLLKDSDRELKRLLDQGIVAVNQPAPPELLKSLLFYVAKSHGTSARMKHLKDRYDLDEALPDSALLDEERARLAGPDRNAMRSVVTALREELVRVKERLDHFVRSDREHTSELASLLPPLRQIADTLAVLGFGQPRKVIVGQLVVIQGLTQGAREPNDATLMDVAGALLYVEATLAGMIGQVEQATREDSRLPTTDLTQIHQIVVRESRVCLQQARDLISDYIDAHWDRSVLQPVPELLTQVRGALAMIPLNRAASLLQLCNGYIEAHLIGVNQQPGWAELEHLADALSAIDYYLERLGQDPQAPGEGVLDLAQENLAALGYQPAAPHAPLLEEVLSPAETLVMGDLQALGSPQVLQSLADVLANPVSSLNPPARFTPQSLLPPPADEVPVDDELREVFLEEAEEVLQVLREFLPRWAANTLDEPALIELRRAFHTLKGSGRMVRALVLGELAWAAENLLNRVLEHSIAATDDVLQLLDEVLAVLPRLVDEFAAQRQAQCAEVDLLAARAHALAKGEILLLPTAADALDPQLLEIFRNEAQGHLRSLDRFLGEADPTEPVLISDEVQRALHTLKGSAYMAGILSMAEVAAAMDYLARELRGHQLPLELEELQLLEHGVRLLRSGIGQLSHAPLQPIPGASQLIAETRERVSLRLAEYLEAGDASPRLKRDPQLISNFLAQGMDILLDAESLLKRWREHPGERYELGALLDELTTLGEGAHLADLMPVDDLCEALLDLYGAVEESSLAVSERFFDEAALAHEGLIDMLDQVAAGQAVEPRPERLLALRALLDEGLDPGAMGLIKTQGNQALSVTDLADATQRLQADEAAPALDNEIVDIFLEEAVDILDSADQAMRRWLTEPENSAPLSSLKRDLHTLKGGARMAEIIEVADLGHELEQLYQCLQDRRCNYGPALAQVLRDSHQRLAKMLTQLQQRQPLVPAAELIETLRQYRHGVVTDSTLVLPEDTKPAASEEGDSELLQIFLEEGQDIVESSGAALLRWQAEPRNTLEIENLLRDLHTLKGGARMVEVAPIGDLAHDMEFLYESLSAGLIKPGPQLFSLLQNGHDRLAHMLDAVRLQQPVKPDNALIDIIRSFVSPVVEAQAEAPLERPAPEPAAQVQERLPGDMVKVAADLLEDLGNLAGETSIFRGRIEQQVNDAQTALTEMETTIERMRDQLRRLDTETQGRILSRQHADTERLGYEDFDPLEMDRHSQLQQLSRALFESASDLLDLQETLSARNHEAQTLLMQQARVNTDLQEGLMRTRMVPFERMLPRLQRLVRQVATELDKQVEFDVSHAEGEIDRSVLERMLAPLEHMLRNAIDHGLEPAEMRVAAGKSEHGHIALSLSHEGGDIVIEMSDDGAGVPLEAVRKKAIKRGLLDPASDISDHDVMQFILQPGFSTAAKVTQISGRGLGMDVVHEEVKQLGGSMTIDSRPGQGARFRIRLPFSVSVNRALMVQCGEEQYALPINTIEGIVRVLPAELEDYYQLDPPRYHYDGQHYELRYLGDLLHSNGRPKMSAQNLPLPLLLVRAHDHQVAVQVDALTGSREIVVKSLGPQFAGVQGLSGATILGDGRVVLILDLLAQVRASHARQLPSLPSRVMPAPQEIEQARPLLVMVVDDSVTVRKVTSRLLERHGMHVLTAKDGVDAMSLLQEHTPDVLLLDIEMPRMDGFEVATEIRQHERLKDLPIIMITSRTGQKHRERAMAIGVNDYLGKPFQESVLLESIAQWSRSHA